MDLPTNPTLSEAMVILSGRGITLRSIPGAYVVNYRSGAADTEYMSDNLDDAFAYGLNMAEPPRSSPPPGPLGPRNRHRSAMYSHNRRVALKHAKRLPRTAVRWSPEIAPDDVY